MEEGGCEGGVRASQGTECLPWLPCRSVPTCPNAWGLLSFPIAPMAADVTFHVCLHIGGLSPARMGAPTRSILRVLKDMQCLRLVSTGGLCAAGLEGGARPALEQCAVASSKVHSLLSCLFPHL